jgi:hypothetical protein
MLIFLKPFLKSLRNIGSDYFYRTRTTGAIADALVVVVDVAAVAVAVVFVGGVGVGVGIVQHTSRLLCTPLKFLKDFQAT